jgi:glyoxylase-like metal-dependent hydrolase (beta-lactamase superfamily II)
MASNRLRTVVPRVIQSPVFGSSVFFLLDDRVTLVDTGPAGSASRILSALQALQRSPDDVEQIIITHCHLDHAGGLAALQRHLPARTAVHVLDAPFVTGDTLMSLPLRLRLPGRAHRRLSRALAPPARIDTLLRDGDELPVLGGLRVVHTPGHTAGHIALHLPAAGLLIAGDALQVRGARITPASRWVSDDYDQAVRSLRALTGLDFDVLALSHFAPQRRAPRDRIAALVSATG